MMPSRSSSRLPSRLGIVPASLCALMFSLALDAAADTNVFVNEIHYDNAGTDSGEAIELVGPAGTDLTGWSVVLYNGSNGTVYNTIALAETLGANCVSHGTAVINLPTNGLQNGSPDGIALVDNTSAVRQFISYEGSFIAVGGPADGQSSSDIGVSEASGTLVGDSLQLFGTGLLDTDFTWTGPAPASFGACNVGQAFDDAPPPPPPPATPDVFLNELHYDNSGGDTGEFFEVAGNVGFDLAGWNVVLYNGSNGTSYNSISLTGSLSDAGDNQGTCAFFVPGIQNGSPDGIAVIEPDGSVAEFWSYEGVLTAADGPAAGLTSTNMGASEASSTPVGESLQRSGSTWIGPQTATPNDCNAEPPTGPMAVKVHDVQGSGPATPLADEVVEIDAIVVADFNGPDPVGGQGLGGFYVQEEDADADADPSTSEGIFVFSSADVAVGDRVRVVGTATEFFDQTQIGSVQSVEIASSNEPLPSPAIIADLASESADLERYEGMRIRFAETLTLVEYFNLDRFGEVALASNGRPFQPTQVLPPGPQALEAAAAIAAAKITLDDASTNQNPDSYFGRGGNPLSRTNLLRGGDTVAALEGILGYSFGRYRVQPVAPVNFEAGGERETLPPAVGGRFSVASFNVLNYFVNIDDPDSRGADSLEELTRQRAKTVTAIAALGADIVGLVEIENDLGSVADEAVADLVTALNAAAGYPEWDYVPTGKIGGDAIKVAFIYRPETIATTGPFAVLDSSVDPNFIDIKNRPALAQTFEETATGERFTLAVNHFKSKGSACDDVGDVNAGDGQGNCNGVRTAAAAALSAWLATDPTGSGDPDRMILGDLNAYAMEDPVSTLEADGYVNLEAVYDEGGYSFLFDGQLGTLDYAMADSCMAEQVTGAGVWNTNADEPDAIDYNLTAGTIDLNRDPSWFDPDSPYRASDHDPLLVGLMPSSLQFVGLPSEGATLRPRSWQRILPLLFGVKEGGELVSDQPIAGLVRDASGQPVRTLRIYRFGSGYLTLLPLRKLGQGEFVVEISAGDCSVRRFSIVR